MIKMDLAFYFDGCPLSWQNFIIWLQKEKDSLYRDVSMDIIQRELKQFNAEYHYAINDNEGFKSPDYVSFDTEQDYTWFTLRWS